MKPVKLTQTIVDRIPPPPQSASGQSRQTFVRNTTTPGFGLRITSNGVKSFIRWAVQLRIEIQVQYSC